MDGTTVLRHGGFPGRRAGYEADENSRDNGTFANGRLHMRTTGIIADLRVPDIESAKHFYTDYLGLSTEGFNMGWVARYSSPDTETRVQLVTHDATAPEDPVVSVLTSDVDAAYEEAQQLGYEFRSEGWIPP
jgi:hypothetical protein